MARMLVIAAAALTVAAPAAAGGPALTLVRAQPTTVRGTGFAPRERVVVRLHGARVRVRTTARGRFVAVLRPADRCSGGRVLAIGTRGDRAVLRLPPLECAPASAP